MSDAVCPLAGTATTRHARRPAVSQGGHRPGASFCRFLPAGMLAALLLTFPGPSGHSMADTPQAPAAEVLERADAFRLPHLEARLDVRLTTRDGDRVTDDSLYRVWTSGTDLSRIEMRDPRVAGQQVLMTPEALWLFIPNTRRSIRITPMQRLMGQANYGDIGRMVWRSDYTAADAPHPPRDLAPDVVALLEAQGDGVRWLILEARTQTAVYPRIHLAVSQTDSRPLYAEYFLISGKLLKTATFASPEDVDGHSVVTQVRFRDALRPEQQTVMELSNIAVESQPASFFTQAGLMRPPR